MEPVNSFGSFPCKSFKAYRETTEAYVLPIRYALEYFGMDMDYPIDETVDSNGYNKRLKCSVVLRDSQKECYEACVNEKENPIGGGIVNIQTGGGKCLGKNTGVMTYSGERVNVQDIIPGDTLMGDDNRPRTVLSVTSDRDQMFEISIQDGVSDPFTVNIKHILCFVNKFTFNYHQGFYNIKFYKQCGEDQVYLEKVSYNNVREATECYKKVTNNYKTICISVENYIKMNVKLMCYRLDILRLPSTVTEREPYLCGVVGFFDKSVIHNSVSVRCTFLKGLFNSEKIKLKENMYYLKLDSIQDKKEATFLLRSLGFYIYSDNSKSLFDFSHIVRFCMCDDMLPEVTEPLKIFLPDFISKYSNTHEIKLTPKGRGNYYGFCIDGNRRFVLYDTFIVTHNTVLGVKIIDNYKMKTLIIMNKNELILQWKKEILKWMPDARIGLIQGKVFDIEDKDIVLGTIQSITIKKHLTHENFKWVKLCVIDEVHNIGSEVFSKIIFKIVPRYIFGLTATLERKDNMEKLIKWYTGDVLYSDVDSSKKQQSEIDMYNFTGKSSVEFKLKDGTPSVAKMITNISQDKERNKWILEILQEILKNKERNILVISDRTAQLKLFNQKLGDKVSGLFIGSVKKEVLEETKTKQVLLGTYGMTNEGFNLPKLNCILFATPRSSITQAIGRIYRKQHVLPPKIIDITDVFSLFKYQSLKRKRIYNAGIQDPIFTYKTFGYNGNFLNTNCRVSKEDDIEELDFGVCLL
jgi:superfamily II DNA or RNA helicase